MKFEVGQKFNATCIFTGGTSTYTIVARELDIIKCESIKIELDGVHHVAEEFKIELDSETGEEKIELWSYCDHKGYLYASQCYKGGE